MDPICISRLLNESIYFNNGLLFEYEIDYTEPLGYFTYSGEEYPYWGNPIGRNRTVDYDLGKFNRYAKLGAVADEIVGNLIGMVEQEYNSIDGRCAYASLIMMKYGIRIGNEGSAEGYASGLEQNVGEIVQTYGVTTLLNEHVSVQNNQLRLHFLGKEQVEHDIMVAEPFFFKYGRMYYKQAAPKESWLGINYETLFNFVKSNIGEAFIPKDLRTFCANISGWRIIQTYLEKPKRGMKSEVNKEVAEIVKGVASRLGNSESIAKHRYLDLRMLDWYKAQRLQI